MTHQCTVLIVDDDAEWREMLAVALAADGWATHIAANGREALNHLWSSTETCVIVLNLMMPVMDGAPFRLAQLRDRSLAWIPIVVVSGMVDAEQTARQLGAAAMLRKPVDLDRIGQALHAVGCPRKSLSRRRTEVLPSNPAVSG